MDPRASYLSLLFLSFEAGSSEPDAIRNIPAQIEAFLEEMRLNNRKPETITQEKYKLLLIARNCDINNPYEAKEFLAYYKNWNSNTKRLAVNHLTAYYKFIGKTWKEPIYKKDEKLPFIPTEQEIDILIASATKRSIVAFLQLLKETGIRTDESRKLLWIDINPNNTINIAPSKNSNGRILPISSKLIGMLSRLKQARAQAMEYALNIHRVNVDEVEERRLEADWHSVVVPSSVKLATDPRNPLKQYY